MQEPKHDLLDDDIALELQLCLDDLKKFAATSEQNQIERAKNSKQQKPEKNPFNNPVIELLEEIREGASNRISIISGMWRPRNRTTPIVPQARIRGEKTPSPKKRVHDSALCSSPSENSPLVFAKWASPDKPTFAAEAKQGQPVRNLSDEFEDRKKQKKSTESDIDSPESSDSSESFSEEYSRGHSPSPVRKKSPKVSPRVNCELESSASLIGSPPSHSHNPSSRHFGSPLVLASPKLANPSQNKSPRPLKTQIVPSQPHSEPELNAHENPLYKTLKTLNNQYKKIIEDERQKLSQLFKHCQALIPDNINLDTPESSLSTWMTKNLLNILSLSSLRQIYEIINNTILSMQSLKTVIFNTNFGCEDQELQSIYLKLNTSIRFAIDQDRAYLSLVSESLCQYEKNTMFFIAYFANTHDETQIFQLLNQLLESSDSINKNYLEKNPTLVRRLVEESFNYLDGVPDTTTRMDFHITIIPKLKSHLVNLINEYEIEKNEILQSRQCVF